jgi:hypothetical protein
MLVARLSNPSYAPPPKPNNRWIAATYRHAAVLIVDTGRVASLAGDAVAHAVAGAFAARGCPLEGLQPWGKDGYVESPSCS